MKQTKSLLLITALLAFGAMTACSDPSSGGGFDFDQNQEPTDGSSGDPNNPDTDSTNNHDGSGNQNNNTTTTNPTPPAPTTCEGKWKAGLLSRWQDEDGDGILNIEDKCPCVKLTDKKLSNHNDRDNDNIGDECDNCPDAANASQKNICDDQADDFIGSPHTIYVSKDTDGDKILDIDDNCINVKNPGQSDTDKDGVGDKCDNCPTAKNVHQVDSNNDGIGDSCSPVPAGPDCSTTGDCADNSLTCKKGVCVCDSSKIEAQRLEPTVVLVLDASGSMNSTRVAKLKGALSNLADKTYNEVRYGVVAYATSVKFSKDIKKYSTANELKGAWSSYSAGGNTETHKGINRAIELIENDQDPKRDLRQKAIVVVTDGGTSETLLTSSVKKATAKDIDTIIVGIQVDGAAGLLARAQKFGLRTQTFVNTDNSTPDQLSNEILKAAKSSLGCDMILGSKPSDPNQIWVYYGGDILKRNTGNTWDYDLAKNAVVFQGAKCDEIKASTTPKEIEIIVGCAGTCKKDQYFIDNPSKTETPSSDYTPPTLWCDYRDNDCSGTIDEGCKNCRGEICGDKTDNDCDGVVDNGCDLGKIGDDCKNDSECFNSICDENTHKCSEICRSLGVQCSDTQPCCQGLSCDNGTCNQG